MDMKIGIVIPCFQAAKHLPYCLPPLLESSLKPHLLVIDSSSTDGTAELAKKMGAETLVIPKREFNHGTTRELGRNYLKTPIIAMMTQDAYATSSGMLNFLVRPLIENQASISYGRQIPHQNADIFESFPRTFNYPSESHIRSLADVKKYGAYSFFCSNSCAAYLNSALDEIGGFASTTFGEDAIATAKLLHRGHKIAYTAEAIVRHSHPYTLKQEFRRHLEIGSSKIQHKKLFLICGSDSKRGREYVKALFKELWRSSPLQLPYACIQTGIKYGGYQLGKFLFIWRKCYDKML